MPFKMQKPKDQHAFIFPNSKHQNQGLPLQTSMLPLAISLSSLYLKKKVIILYVYTCVYDIHTVALRGKKRMSDHQELKF